MASMLLRTLGRRSLTASLAARHTGLLTKSSVPMGTVTAYKQMEDFWATNRKLGRPLSPHLRIYKPQLTSMLSLCHRLTGIGMAVSISAASITLFALPGDFPTYLTMIQGLSLGPAIIIAAKYILAFPVTYHYINGIRHLAWDWALGCGLQTIYKTGWFAFFLAILVSSGFVFYF